MKRCYGCGVGTCACTQWRDWVS